MDLMRAIEIEQIASLGKEIPDFKAGDTIRVGVEVSEGYRKRVQYYEGVCIARKHGSGINGSFTVRKISFGEGVERVFPLHATSIKSIALVRRGRVRRAKLYYLRDRRGRAARIPEKTNYKPLEQPYRRLGSGDMPSAAGPANSNTRSKHIDTTFQDSTNSDKLAHIMQIVEDFNLAKSGKTDANLPSLLMEAGSAVPNLEEFEANPHAHYECLLELLSHSVPLMFSGGSEATLLAADLTDRIGRVLGDAFETPSSVEPAHIAIKHLDVSMMFNFRSRATDDCFKFSIDCRNLISALGGQPRIDESSQTYTIRLLRENLTRLEVREVLKQRIDALETEDVSFSGEDYFGEVKEDNVRYTLKVGNHSFHSFSPKKGGDCLIIA